MTKNNPIAFELFIVALLIGLGTPFFALFGYVRGNNMAPQVKEEPLQKIAAAQFKPAKDLSHFLVSSDAAIKKGKEKYNILCALCHGVSGKGDGPAGKVLKPPARNFINAKEKWTHGYQPLEMFKGITRGSPGTGMAGFKETLSFEERWAVVHYLTSLDGLKERITPISKSESKKIFSEIAE